MDSASEQPFIYYKMDIYFANSIAKCSVLSLYIMRLHIFKTVLLIVYVFLYNFVMDLKSKYYLGMVYLALYFTMVNMIALHYERKIISDKRNKNLNLFYLKEAYRSLHVVYEEEIYEEELNYLDDCISQTIYFGLSRLPVDNPFLTERYKNFRERELAIYFYCMFLPKANCKLLLIHSFRHLASAILYILLVLFRILQTNQQYSSSQFGPVAIFVLLDLITGWMLVLVFSCILGFLIFLPVYLCIEGCFKLRKCMRRVKRRFMSKRRLQVDQQCSICLDALKQSEKIQILECSQKHTFHRSCISQWLMNHRQCPLCRTRVESDVIMEMKEIGQQNNQQISSNPR